MNKVDKKEYYRQWREKNREKYNEYLRNYYQNNKEKIKERIQSRRNLLKNNNEKEVMTNYVELIYET